MHRHGPDHAAALCRDQQNMGKFGEVVPQLTQPYVGCRRGSSVRRFQHTLLGLECGDALSHGSARTGVLTRLYPAADTRHAVVMGDA
jgi:hypothetical protein